MPPNRQPPNVVLKEIAKLWAALSERACRERAERMARQASEEGRAEMVRKLRKNRGISMERPLNAPPAGPRVWWG